MRILALLCYSTAMFALAWALSMRFTDSNTPRWEDSGRWYKLMIPAFASFFLLHWLGSVILPQDSRNSASFGVAQFAGFTVAVVMYVLVAWSKPGFLGTRPYTRASPPEPPMQAPRSIRDWLLSDVRNLPKNLRKKNDANK